MRQSRSPTRQRRTRDELASLLEDALSAAAGWTVPPPDIQALDATAGEVNWTVDTGRMDESMRAAVRNLQARYELDRPRPPGSFRLFSGGGGPWRRGRQLLA